MRLVLVEPEIAPNTGNIARLCAATRTELHLIEPLGFELGDRELKRAGLDYHEMTCVTVHPDLDACFARLPGRRRFALTTKAGRAVHDVAFEPGDVFVFGPETRGLPDVVLTRFDETCRLRLPMVPGNRSLNLSNAVAVVVYEAWRQQGFRGGS